ncbi:MAG: hypothetical protein M1818_004215, partial [Claussenomyces sp. TS43310]
RMNDSLHAQLLATSELLTGRTFTYGNVTQDGQEDVDEEIATTTTLQEDTERWQDDGKDDLADIAGQRVRLAFRSTLLSHPSL